MCGGIGYSPRGGTSSIIPFSSLIIYIFHRFEKDAFPEKTGKIKDEMKALSNLINERVELQKLSAKSADVLRQAANKLASTSN